MKTFKLYSILTTLLLLMSIGCSKDFLEDPPLGIYSESTMLNKKGIEGLLIGAYGGLDGERFSGLSNWFYGSARGGEAHRGSTGMADKAQLDWIIQWDTPISSPDIKVKWNFIYEGVSRANIVIKTLSMITDPAVTDVNRTQIIAQARFLRAFNYFEGKKIFNNVPYVDETVTDFKVPNFDASGNYIDIWPQIEADFQNAYNNLPETWADVGRVNKWAAAAYLGKAYLYQKKYAEAKTIFDQVIQDGKTSLGVKYDLYANLGDAWRIAAENGKETIFSVQYTIDANPDNGNNDMRLTYPFGIGGNSFFFRVSQDVVNTFRTDANGMPMPSTYNNESVTSNESVSDQDPFTPYSGTLDPRLDHTVGRRGIPYLDWGLHTGNNFTTANAISILLGGPYNQKKIVFTKAEKAAGLVTHPSSNFANSHNVPLMRFADLLLMAAECEIELNNLNVAMGYINKVRQRAANSVVMNLDNTAPAANYKVGLYTSFANQEAARTAVRFERRLELAEEGHRFFDLVRWGITEEFINNEYLPFESILRPVTFTPGAQFNAGKDEYQPIPEYSITQSFKNGVATLKQNPGY